MGIGYFRNALSQYLVIECLLFLFFLFSCPAMPPFFLLCEPHPAEQWWAHDQFPADTNAYGGEHRSLEVVVS
jgi:hypothetical protein